MKNPTLVCFTLLFLWSCSWPELQESWTAGFPFQLILSIHFTFSSFWPLASSLILFTVHLAHNFRKGWSFAATQLTNKVKSWTFLREYSESTQDYTQLYECRKQTSTDPNPGKTPQCLNVMKYFDKYLTGAHLRFSEMSVDCYFPDCIQYQCIKWQGKEDINAIQNTFTETINAVALCLSVFSISRQAGPCLLVVVFVPLLSSRHFVLRQMSKFFFFFFFFFL